MTGINDIVEESTTEQFYVFRGPKDARAVELVYHGHRWVFNERTKDMSLITAKAALRLYKETHGLGGFCAFWPSSSRWATMTPVFAETRDAELRALAEKDMVRFAIAQGRVMQ